MVEQCEHSSAEVHRSTPGNWRGLESINTKAASRHHDLRLPWFVVCSDLPLVECAVVPHMSFERVKRAQAGFWGWLGASAFEVSETGMSFSAS